MVGTCSATHVGDKVKTELRVAVAFVDVGTFDSGTFVKFVAFAGKASVVVRTGGVVVAVVGVVSALIYVAATICEAVAFISSVAWADIHIAVVVN